MDGLILGLKISVIGFSIVFIALTIIMYAISSFSLIDQWVAEREKKKTAVKKELMDNRGPGIPLEVIAVITAAITTATYKKFVIKRIKYRSSPAETSWTKEGRAMIMATRSAAERR